MESCYTEMKNIEQRLRELAKLDYPQYRSRYMPDGSLETKITAEYLEEQSLISRWNELQKYERSFVKRNPLLISLDLDLILTGLQKRQYDPSIAGRIAVSVYLNTGFSMSS